LPCSLLLFAVRRAIFTRAYPVSYPTGSNGGGGPPFRRGRCVWSLRTWTIGTQGGLLNGEGALVLLTGAIQIA
jgi:hypothetical protein